MKQLTSQTPRLLIVTGLPGSGKSMFANAFSEAFHTPFLDTVILYDNVDDPNRANALTKEIFSQLLKTQRTIVIEPVTGSRNERAEFAKMARDAGYAPLTVWVQTEAAIAKRRSTVSTRNHQAMYDADSYEKAAKRFTPPIQGEAHCVISGMHTQPSQLRVVLKRLSEQSGRNNIALSRTERTEIKSIRPRLVQ